VERLEKQVKELSAALAQHLSNQPRLLWGWKAIGEYAVKSPRTLQRYARLYGFPVARVSQNAVSSPTLIDAFLLAKSRRDHARQSAMARNEAAPASYMGTFWRNRKNATAEKPLQAAAAR
jgi:hypothetical protein